ncbi:hypothetical protein AB0K16_59830 [Nonomuraea jabiensis]|uniref:hypothetical protein n=1 Tax=Nonomuraea jabiensis TaxID=882448 RepID=UPI0034260446
MTAIQPVKAEMSTSTIKSSAADPSNLDSIVVCRPIESASPLAETIDQVVARATDGLRECQVAKIKVGFADVESVVRGSVLSLHTHPKNDADLGELEKAANLAVDRVANSLGIRSNRSAD